MWEALKGLAAFIVLSSIVIAVLAIGWSISILFRVVIIFIAMLMFIGFLVFCIYDWFSGKMK